MYLVRAPATIELYTLSLHDALPISTSAGLKLSGAEYVQCSVHGVDSTFSGGSVCWFYTPNETAGSTGSARSEEHTSELQSQSNLVCRLLLEKKKKQSNVPTISQSHT